MRLLGIFLILRVLSEDISTINTDIVNNTYTNNSISSAKTLLQLNKPQLQFISPHVNSIWLSHTHIKILLYISDILLFPDKIYLTLYRSNNNPIYYRILNLFDDLYIVNDKVFYIDFPSDIPLVTDEYYFSLSLSTSLGQSVFYDGEKFRIFRMGIQHSLSDDVPLLEDFRWFGNRIYFRLKNQDLLGRSFNSSDFLVFKKFDLNSEDFEFLLRLRLSGDTWYGESFEFDSKRDEGKVLQVYWRDKLVYMWEFSQSDDIFGDVFGGY